MKTASRILGSAAFHAGFDVQDSPVYGAERRGAPMMAFVRMAKEPILERGPIERPHVVLVSDDTLLEDRAASPLAGCGDATIVVLNSAGNGTKGRRIHHDFTTLALKATSSLASLSTALGAAAACLVGISEDDAVEGVKDELADLGAGKFARNVDLAREIYSLGVNWPRLDWPANEESVGRDAALVDLRLDPPRRATPNIYASGNTAERGTGSWRQFRPVLEKENCNRCWLCFVSCPVAAIGLDAEEFPLVDYEVCKGCLLCAHECPTHAFRIEGRYRHLFEPERNEKALQRIQRQVDDYWKNVTS